jgi:hypothetical protein
VVRVGDCHRQGVGRIGADDLGAGKQVLDHRMDLRLLRIADTDHGLLHETRRILADLDAGPRRNHQNDSARLAELQCRLRVLVDEDFLDRCRLGPMIGNERFKLGGEVRQSLRQALARIGFQLPVRNVGQAIAFGADQAPSGRAEARIEAEDYQASFSSSASLIS